MPVQCQWPERNGCMECWGFGSWAHERVCWRQKVEAGMQWGLVLERASKWDRKWGMPLWLELSWRAACSRKGSCGCWKWCPLTKWQGLFRWQECLIQFQVETDYILLVILEQVLPTLPGSYPLDEKWQKLNFQCEIKKKFLSYTQNFSARDVPH